MFSMLVMPSLHRPLYVLQLAIHSLQIPLLGTLRPCHLHLCLTRSLCLLNFHALLALVTANCFYVLQMQVLSPKVRDSERFQDLPPRANNAEHFGHRFPLTERERERERERETTVPDSNPQSNWRGQKSEVGYGMIVRFLVILCLCFPICSSLSVPFFLIYILPGPGKI